MKHAFKSLDDRAIEWYSALVMLAWGLTLAQPSDLLSSPQFVAFHRFGITEAAWAFIFTAAGTLRLGVLAYNGRWPKHPYPRMALSFFGAVSWAQIGWLLFEGSYATGILTTGPLTYGLLALFDVLSIYRAAFDARYNHP
jgi:hypothetical protein